MRFLQHSSRWAFSASKLSNTGAGTKKLRRAKPPAPRPCPCRCLYRAAEAILEQVMGLQLAEHMPALALAIAEDASDRDPAELPLEATHQGPMLRLLGWPASFLAGQVKVALDRKPRVTFICARHTWATQIRGNRLFLELKPWRLQAPPGLFRLKHQGKDVC
jgi:hypothetical protein